MGCHRLRWAGLNGSVENNKGTEPGIFAAKTRRSRSSSKEMEINFGRDSPQTREVRQK